MKVVLLAHTPTPEQTVAAAARLCYSDTDVEALRESISQEKAEQFVEMLAGFGHESPVHRFPCRASAMCARITSFS